MIWGERGSILRMFVAAGQKKLEIERDGTMKFNEAIKSNVKMASTLGGRAYGVGRVRVVMGILVAGTVWGYAPAARAEAVFWCADSARTAPFCNPNPGPVVYTIAIPGLVDFLRVENGPPGNFVERLGAGTAHFTGKVHKWDDTDIEFDVDMIFSGRLDSGDEGYPPPGSPVVLLEPIFCPFDTSTWHYYTALTGTLTGQPGSIYDGAVYSVTLGPNAAQLGNGANNTQGGHGLWSTIIVEAIGELPDPSLPTGPLEGIIALRLLEGCFPPPVVDLTGTWTGSIECAGYDFDFDAVPQEQFSTDVVLKLGNQSDFSQYSAELTENATVETFCGQITHNLGSESSGQGGLTSSTGTVPPVFLKVADVDREASPAPTGQLRARQIHVTPQGSMLCKWSLTLTDTADPQIANTCP